VGGSGVGLTWLRVGGGGGVFESLPNRGTKSWKVVHINTLPIKV